MSAADVTVWTLATDGADLPQVPRPDPDVAIRPAPLPTPAFNRFLYTAIGGAHHWVDRLDWDHAAWLAWLDRPEVETWVSYRLGSPLGYVELERRGDVVEIAYFGVLAEARGRGVGRHLLAHAVRRGLALGAVEVRVETCSLDGPGALATYRGAGFIVVSEHVERRALHPDPGPW